MSDSVIETAAAVRQGDVSPRALVDEALERIGAQDGGLNCFVAIDAERARADADRLEARRAAGETLGVLAGVPIGVKDLEDAAGFVTTCGDPARRDAPPAVRDSVEVERLRTAG